MLHTLGMLGVDLGTTHTVIAKWDGERAAPLVTPFGKPEAPELIPTALFFRENPSFWQRMVMRKPLIADVGYPAVTKQRDAGRYVSEFCAGFKTALGRDPLTTVAKLKTQRISARDAMKHFLAALPLNDARCFAVPVDAYETYRAELGKARLIDEPLAAAIGYGLEVRSERCLLVVDCGGGTMHAATVRLSSQGVRAGGCTVLGKAGRPLGGDTVDQWLYERLTEQSGFPLHVPATDWARALWRRQVLDEVRAAKEAVYAREEVDLVLTPPDDMIALKEKRLTLKRSDVHDELRARGFFNEMDAVITEASTATPDDVIVIGGSTLLPGVYAYIADRFGRDRVRAWQPFTAVAIGAAAYAAGALVQADHIVHDYAILTHDLTSHAPQHTVIVPRGTPVPSQVVWQRALVPTCATGLPETQFRLVVCEIGGNSVGRSWDAAGNLFAHDGTTRVVPLNQHAPTLGTITPPHSPKDREPRLDVQFWVDADRWLRCTVQDLRTKRHLLKSAAVVRLL